MSSSSLHSEACNALGASDGVIHSSISHEVVSLRATTNYTIRTETEIFWEMPAFCPIRWLYHFKKATFCHVARSHHVGDSLLDYTLYAQFLHDAPLPLVTKHHVLALCAPQVRLPMHMDAYLLGLLAMIKCSICSYQCDN